MVFLGCVECYLSLESFLNEGEENVVGFVFA